MLVKKCLIKDLPQDIKRNFLIKRFLPRVLFGYLPIVDKKEERCIAILVRLILKARDSYLLAREAMMEEEYEGHLSHKEIYKRGNGQYIYTYPIINNLEDCIITLHRIYKILVCHFEGIETNNNIRNLRDSIQHIESRITDNPEEYPSIEISDNTLILEVAGSKKGKKVRVQTNELADAIIFLTQVISSLLCGKKGSKIKYKNRNGHNILVDN